MIHADVCSNCHPFYTGKQKILDTGGRVARFERRFGKKASRQQVARRADHRVRGGAVSAGATRSVSAGDRDVSAPQRLARGGTVFERLADLADEHAELERDLADPAVHADQDARTRAGPPLRRADPDRRAPTASGSRQPPTRRRRASWPPRTRRSRPRPSSSPRTAPSSSSSCSELLVPARPQRRQGRHPRGQGGGGRRGVRAVRRRPAADVPALRRAAAAGRPRSSTPPMTDLGGYKDVTVAVKARAPRAGDGVWSPAEVRGRRAPGAAGAGDRVAGPHPHLRGRRAGHARGRAGRGRASTRTTCGSTCSARPGPAARA